MQVRVVGLSIRLNISYTYTNRNILSRRGKISCQRCAIVTEKLAFKEKNTYLKENCDDIWPESNVQHEISTQGFILVSFQ